ncbi:hypothetical protein A3E39_00185 [Candidatus Uhrbacteria bacterium RIFCSPHIGHO2_12_FULL_60_25]|uniref:Uncharacterized protein n=1 Tax=Candidatus Uhrbacteria bacterium RIFCSPHIGHO2_12_FULL_60_25 TaxID=1802399 RepID=A0A1F7UP36_9BACT|nr:MAG: hypothetical protein A3E39_00185 [Candidatus Uhrbacteria bacterium RIFCSPHIGHO2_12_FULL_60_25]
MRSSFMVRSIVAVTLLASAVAPTLARAAEASHDAVLGAVAELRKFGPTFCTESKKNFGDDCVRTEFSCRDAPGTIAGTGGALAGSGAGLAAGGLAGAVVGGIAGYLTAKKYAGIEEYWSLRYEQAGGNVQLKQGLGEPLALDWLRADWSTNSKRVPPGYFLGTCYCGCPENATFEPCKGKPAGTPFRTAEDLTYEQCLLKCKPNPIAQKCAGALPPVSRQALTGAPGSQAGVSLEDTTCFRPDECAAQRGIYEAYDKCTGGKGRCYAEEPTLTLNVAIGSVTEVKGFNNYVIAAYRYLIAIGFTAATAAFVWGAFLYLLGTALPQISKGKTYMVDAIMGFLLILGANLILRTINPATTRLNPIRVPMVNTVQFISSTYCKDLGNMKTAAAGVKPNITPYAEVAKDPKNFKTAAADTLCGTDYWVQDATGSTCEGSKCEQPGEACSSCADATNPGCVGVASDKRVCGNAVFAGTIDYIDKKFPSEVTLVAFCNSAQTDNASVVADNLSGYRPTTPGKVGRSTSQGKTDDDDIGRASFRLPVTPLDIAKAVADCGSGGLRGFVLGLDINENFGVDDSAVLSKRNCGKGKFDGYTNGGFGSDIADYADAVVCGVKSGKFLDDPQKSNFWTKDELDSAIKGSPITCNFSLSNENAPDDPGTKFCGGGGGAGEAVPVEERPSYEKKTM